MYKVTDRLFKESIVDSFYNCAIPEDVFVTTLAGPDFDRVINLAHDSLNPIEINSYEINEKIYQSQLAQHSFLEEDVQLITNVYHENVDKAIVTNFMDIDLMGTVLTQGAIVQNLLAQQSLLKGTKCFIGTFSARVAGIKDTFSQIRNIIGMATGLKVSIKDTVTESLVGEGWRYSHKHKTVHTAVVKSFDVYHYADAEGPMVTFRLIYKNYRDV